MKQMRKIESSALCIRHATLRDLNALVRLDAALIRFDRAFDPTLKSDWSRTSGGLSFFRSHLRGHTAVVLLAEWRGAPIGYLVGEIETAEDYRQPMKLAEVECLFVRERFRRCGIGARLLSAFESWARRAGAQRVRVVVSAANQRALAFYERKGFRPYDAVLEKPLRRTTRSTKRPHRASAD